jgi:hypothetical protein
MADHVDLPESVASDQTIPSRMPCSLTNLHDSFPVSLCPLPAESMAVDRPSGLAEKNAIRASTWRRKAKVMQAPREWPEQMTAAGAAMQNGDPDPVINSWADSDEITLFGAWGPIEKGLKAVTDTMRWVGSRFTGADVVDVGACRRRLQRRPRLHGRLRAHSRQRRRRPDARHGDSGHPHLPAHRRRLEARAPARRLPSSRSTNYLRQSDHGPSQRGQLARLC